MRDYKFYIKKLLSIPPIEELIPTEEDINGSKKLSEALKDDSKDKTLINIIKFQEDTIPYWNERRIITDEPKISFLIGVLSVIISIVVSFLIIMLVYIILPTITKSTVTAMILSRTFGITIFVVLILVLLLIFHCTLKITLIAVSVDRLRKSEFCTKNYIKCGRDIKKYISANNLPVEKILAWNLAICRDYARLTASLLYNLYSDSEIYIVNLSTHQASGIKFNDKILVLDPNFSSPTNKVSILNDWLKENNIDDDFYCLEGKIKNFTILIYDKSRYWKYVLKYLDGFYEPDKFV